MSANYPSPPLLDAKRRDNMMPNRNPMPEHHQVAVGPGLYKVLSVPAEAPRATIICAYEGLMYKAKKEDLNYDEPDVATKQAKEDRIKELEEAAKILTDPFSRAQHDRAMFTLFELNMMDGCYPDIWIARRDGRVRSDGMPWQAPVERTESPYLRPAPLPMPMRRPDEYRPGSQANHRDINGEWRIRGQAQRSAYPNRRESPSYAPYKWQDVESGFGRKKGDALTLGMNAHRVKMG